MDDRSSKPKTDLKKSPDDNRGGDRHGARPDANQIAFSVVQQATGQIPKVPEEPKKNPAAVTLGHLGGLTPARAAGLSDRAWEIADIVALLESTRSATN